MSGPWEKYQGAQTGGASVQPEGAGMAQGVTQAFGRGASFGLSDRAGAALSSLIGGWQDAGEYGDYGGTYSENLADIHKQRDQFYEDHPVAATVANIAGGVASGIPIAKAASAIPMVAKAYEALNVLGKGAKVKKYATTGALAGGAAGAGNADEGDVLAEAGKGAATGAVLGTVLPPVLSGAAKLLNNTVGVTVRAGVNALRSPEDQTTRQLSKNLSRDNISIDQLEQGLHDMGPGAMIADVAGKNTLAQADLAATVPGPAKDASLKALETRAKGTGGRVVGALKQGLGVDSTNFDELQQGLHTNMRDVAAKHGYDEILNNGSVELTPRLQKLMQGDTMKAALNRARSIISDDVANGEADSAVQKFFKETPQGVEFAPIPETERAVLTGRRVPQSGRQPQTYELNASREAKLGPARVLSNPNEISGEVATRPTLRAWDYVKRGLDGIIRDGTDPTSGKLTEQAVSALKSKKILLREIEATDPENAWIKKYTAVRSDYADEKAGESAMQMGRTFLHDDSEVTARHIKDMSPGEQKYFRAGAARAVYDKIMAAPNTGMAYSVFLKRPLLTEKLQAAFGGNTPEFQTFMKQLGNEARMGETHAAVGKNSMTAARQAVAQDQGAPITSNSIPTSKTQAIRSAMEWLTRARPAVANAHLDAATTQDPAAQSEIIRRLRDLDANMQRPAVPQQVKNGANYLLTKEVGQRRSSK